MELRFPEQEIAELSRLYEYKEVEDLEVELMNVVALSVKKKGYLTKDELRKVCDWKSARSAWNVEKNEEDFVKEVTKFALETKNMRASIESLIILNGVLWPTASVILHLFHKDRFPIIDFRALWSVGVYEDYKKEYKNKENKFHKYDLWKTYTRYCREIADNAGVLMRDLDRALWQYSKSNQGT